MSAGLLCELTPEQVAAIAAGEQVLRLVEMGDGEFVSILLCVTQRPMVHVRGHAVVAVCADEARAFVQREVPDANEHQ